MIRTCLKHSAATISISKLIIHLKPLLSSKPRDILAEPFLFLHYQHQQCFQVMKIWSMDEMFGEFHDEDNIVTPAKVTPLYTQLTHIHWQSCNCCTILVNSN